MGRAFVVCVGVLVACSGTVQEHRLPDDGGAAAQAGTSGDGALGGVGGSATGGVGGLTGGSGGKAGASGGVGGSAGVSGSAGSAGAAGSVGGDAGVDVCALPAVAGNCLAAFPRYYFDALAGACRDFIYGGCGGNENNFVTLEECESACAYRADVCQLCDMDVCVDHSCSLCPPTRDASGQLCEQTGMQCVFLPGCGATTCTCQAVSSAESVWECVSNPC